VLFLNGISCQNHNCVLCFSSVDSDHDNNCVSLFLAGAAIAQVLGLVRDDVVVVSPEGADPSTFYVRVADGDPAEYNYWGSPKD
jgi:hypothetical protein